MASTSVPKPGRCCRGRSAESGHTDQNQRWVGLQKFRRTNAEPLQIAEPKALDHHLEVPDEVEDDVLRLGLFRSSVMLFLLRA
jgi:hypothetical protein